MDKIWQESSTRHTLWENIIKILTFLIQDGRRPPFWKTLKTPQLLNCLPNIHPISSPRRFVSSPRRWFYGQKWNFAKFKMASDARLKFASTAITSKWLVRFGSNLVGIIFSAPAISIIKSLNFEIQDGCPPPFLKNEITEAQIVQGVCGGAMRLK